MMRASSSVVSVLMKPGSTYRGASLIRNTHPHKTTIGP